jgi:ubiquinone/menaquinone biosynthesis C-methylase UbiE
MNTHPFKYSFTTCFKERVVSEFLKPDIGHRVLEMGCGSAYFASVMSAAFPKTKFEYVGIDMADASLEYARHYVGPRGELVKGSVMEMPFSDNSFNDVLYLDVIEHVADDRKSVEEAFRVLEPGGRLVISTPNAGAPLTDTFFCEYMHDHGHMANERAGYKAPELSNLLRSVGFEIERVDYSNVFLSELLITATKLGYRLLKPKYESQADMLDVSKSFFFSLHKYLFFPLGYVIGRAEEIFLKGLLDGHCLIILARKPK